MSERCEMCNGMGVVFKPGMPGLDDKDTCPECGGRGIVESVTVPVGKRDAAADLATCDATGDTEWAYEFYSEALPYWLREVERLRGVAEANLAMSADLIAMEGRLKEAKDEYRACGIERAEFHVELVLAREQITHLKHELDRSRNAHGKAELELARLRTTLASIEEYGTEEINAGIELRQENERLRAMQRHAPKAGWGCWKWLSESEEHIRCPEVLPRPMFDALRGYDELESSSSSRAYLSREDAMNALRSAFDAVAKQQQ